MSVRDSLLLGFYSSSTLSSHTFRTLRFRIYLTDAPVGFNHREGLALSTITYNDHGEVRPVLYRLSLAEMVVPYAAPEHPHPRKFAFDSYVVVSGFNEVITSGPEENTAWASWRTSSRWGVTVSGRSIIWYASPPLFSLLV
jgi:hypothetical protein